MYKKRVLLLSTVLFLSLLLIGCTEQETKIIPEDLSDEVSILFIGNSLTLENNLPDNIKDIAESKGKEVFVDYELCKEGYTLKQFWDEGLYAEKFKERKWDYVVLQEQSNTPVKNKEDFYTYGRLFDKEIKAIGTETILYNPQAKGKDKQTLPNIQKLYTNSYLELAKELEALIVPAGPAWVDLNKTNPDIVLYSSDNIHPSEYGTYLTASVFYSVIFNESPEGSIDILNDPEQTAIIQKSAWNSVVDFYNENELNN